MSENEHAQKLENLIYPENMGDNDNENIYFGETLIEKLHVLHVFSGNIMFINWDFFIFQLGILHHFKVFSYWEWGRISAPNLH